MARTLPRRDEVPVADTWAVETVFASEAAFNEAFAATEALLPNVEQFAGTTGDSAGQLLAALRAVEELRLAAARIYLYASMMREGEMTNPDHAAREDRAGGLLARAGAAAAFLNPEILAIPADTLDVFIAEEPGLEVYRHFFDQLGLLRGHVRSSEVEAVLAQAGDVIESSWRAYNMLTNADLRFTHMRDEKGEEVELAQGNAHALILSPIRAVRRAAWEGYADGYLGVRNTLAINLTGAIKRDVFYARAHNYESAREASMQPHGIPPEVFDNLITTVRANLPLWHRYWAIRKRALGVDRLQSYDLHNPLATAEDEITYDRAVEMLLEGLVPLGAEYRTIARRGMTTERWVDKYPNQGKGSGAFSSGVPGTYPFLMQNFDNDLMSLSTLAHEMGHSMHSYFSWATQPPIYGDYSMFVAETASNFNQALLRAHLLKSNTDPRFQVAVIEEGMANFQRYFFIMPILAQFELAAHERVERGEGLNADWMSAKIVELYREGYGAEVEMDEARVGITWAQFPHLYGNFYVYQYATGISAANALADGVLTEGAAAAERYLQFLKAGNSVYSLDALKLAGIDMTTPAPIERAFGVLKRLVDQLDTLVGAGPLAWLPKPDEE
jgi:oligoendopeptidase F